MSFWVFELYKNVKSWKTVHFGCSFSRKGQKSSLIHHGKNLQDHWKNVHFGLLGTHQISICSANFCLTPPCPYWNNPTWGIAWRRLSLSSGIIWLGLNVTRRKIAIEVFTIFWYSFCCKGIWYYKFPFDFFLIWQYHVITCSKIWSLLWKLALFQSVELFNIAHIFFIFSLFLPGLCTWLHNNKCFIYF